MSGHAAPSSALPIAVIEIGGTSVKIGFADAGGPAGFTRTCPTAQIRVADPVGALAALVRDAGRDAGLAPAQAVATVPGFIARDFDTVLHAANVPELVGLRLASGLAQALGMPVALERDVVLQLLGECRAGAVLGERHVLAIYIGTGIGAAYMGEGSVFRGGGWALEIGHMPLHGLGHTLPGMMPDQLEAYASGRALVALAERHGVPVPALFTAAGDAGLRAALAAVIRDQALAIASAVALLSPKIVLLGGGVVDMAGYPRDRLATAIAARFPLPAAVQTLDLRWASLGWRAAIWGALGLVQAMPRPVP